MKTLVVVDIQPAYAYKWPNTEDAMKTINNHEGNIILFVNEELTDDSMDDIKMWWLENGMDESVLERATLYDKGYGLLRDWMDMGIDNEVIIKALHYMNKNNLYSSDDIDIEDETLSEEIKDALEAGVIHANFLEESIIQKISKDYLLIGGGKNECLEEVKIFLEYEGKRAEPIEHLIYDGDYGPDKSKKHNFSYF